MTDTTTQAREWNPPRTEPQGLASPEHLERWRSATRKTREVAERNQWSKAEVSRRSGVPQGTFSPWYDGNYTGSIHRQTQHVERWLDSLDEAARFITAGEPDFVRTRTAADITERLVIAQELPTMAVVVAGAGMGKTMTARHFATTRPHVTMITMRPSTAKVRGMLVQLGMTLGCGRTGVTTALSSIIGERLQRNGRRTLLIVDEAQHLTDDAVNELRFFLDVNQCGIALLGNEELYGRFGISHERAAYAQLHSRVFARLHRLKPLQADIDAYVQAWNLTDRDVIDFVRAIGRKPGALRQIAATLKLAHIIAAGDEATLGVKHLERAWENRGEEAATISPRRSAA